MPRNLYKLITLLRKALFGLGTLLSLGHAAHAQGMLSVVLFYGSNPPAPELRGFDWVVLDPDHDFLPHEKVLQPALPLAYVAIGEAHPTRPWFRELAPGWSIGDNPSWGSKIMDMANPEWRAFLLERVILPLWEKGYRGFFLDTLDSYALVKGVDPTTQQQGLIQLIRDLKTRFPQAKLILNRGFELLSEIHELVDMIAAESLFRSWDADLQGYREVSESERSWLLARFDEARKLGIPCLSIDYVPVHDRVTTRTTAARIKSAGCIPYVTDPDLTSVGVGAVEIVPRRVLVLYDGQEAPHLRYTNAARFLQMPVEYMGYVVDYADVRQPLPDDVHPDRYAGIISWFTGGIPADAAARLNAWWAKRIDEGLPYAVLGDFPQPMSSDLLERMEIAKAEVEGRLEPTTTAPLLGLEITPPVHAVQDVFLPGSGSEILQGYRDTKGQTLAAAVITPRGGIVLDPFVVQELPGIEQSRWVIDPFGFIQRALRLAPIPVPDVTTENGRRLMTVHIDGDGFMSRAEFPGAPLAGRVLLEEVFKRYRVPTSMSIIEAETAPHGLYPATAEESEAIAREMMRLPHIEPAIHTFSHPFVWSRAKRKALLDNEATGEAPDSFYLEVPGYTFNLEREIVGSARYINERLSTPDKPVRVLHWSGDCAPDAEAVTIANRAGLLNINGGDTLISRSNPSLTAVGSWALRFDGVTQVHAPITNENIYTNLWTSPFDGFRRVIETLKMTDKPRRLKPLGIYYHTYSASKPASLKALRDVYDWALQQPVNPVFTSDYIRKVLDFYQGALARQDDRWIWRGSGALRTLRLPKTLTGSVDMRSSTQVAGWSFGVDGRYVHLASGNASLTLRTESLEDDARLVDANGRIESMERTPKGLKLTLHGAVPLEWRTPIGCESLADGRKLSARTDRDRMLSFRVKNARATIEIRCDR